MGIRGRSNIPSRKIWQIFSPIITPLNQKRFWQFFAPPPSITQDLMFVECVTFLATHERDVIYEPPLPMLFQYQLLFLPTKSHPILRRQLLPYLSPIMTLLDRNNFSYRSCGCNSANFQLNWFSFNGFLSQWSNTPRF